MSRCVFSCCPSIGWARGSLGHDVAQLVAGQRVGGQGEGVLAREGGFQALHVGVAGGLYPYL